jgi:methylenetetrahydrofolate--tRNA-(uracil-5-)-methyltransferase
VVFRREVTRAIAADPLIELRRVKKPPLFLTGQITIIASGPLTSEALAAEIGRLTGSDRLFFYDSISPIVEADSIDMNIAFRASALR